MDIEHVNLVVTDPRRSAELMERLFDWHVRWRGDALMGGHSIHVGTDDTYLALYGPPDVVDEPYSHGYDRPALAHIGVLVDDLNKVERRVEGEGIETFNHDSTAPGRRFYFFDPDGICFEVASYS